MGKLKQAEKCKFIVKFSNSIGGVRNIEYLGTGTYFVAGERYAVLVGNSPAAAKRYSSRARAKNAVEKLAESCVNVYLSESIIEEVEE